VLSFYIILIIVCMWGNHQTTALSLAGKGRVVTEKRATQRSMKIPCPSCLNAVYISCNCSAQCLQTAKLFLHFRLGSLIGWVVILQILEGAWHSSWHIECCPLSEIYAITFQSWTLPSCLLSKNKIRIYKTVILLVVLYGCETWSVTDGVWEQGAQENVWTEEKWNGRRLEKTV
jgi:hypothetical protein